jgi:hypothetical protein
MLILMLIGMHLKNDLILIFHQFYQFELIQLFGIFQIEKKKQLLDEILSLILFEKREFILLK